VARSNVVIQRRRIIECVLIGKAAAAHKSRAPFELGHYRQFVSFDTNAIIPPG